MQFAYFKSTTAYLVMHWSYCSLALRHFSVGLDAWIFKGFRTKIKNFKFFKQFCKDIQVLKVCHKIMGFKSLKHFTWRPENVDMPDGHKV